MTLTIFLTMKNMTPREGCCMVSNTAEGELARRGAEGNSRFFDFGCGSVAL
jgi:hypothetical protein